MKSRHTDQTLQSINFIYIYYANYMQRKYYTALMMWAYIDNSVCVANGTVSVQTRPITDKTEKQLLGKINGLIYRQTALYYM